MRIITRTVFTTIVFLFLIGAFILLIGADVTAFPPPTPTVAPDSTLFRAKDGRPGILLWPKHPSSSSTEWTAWLMLEEDSPYLFRDNLLISVRALAQRLSPDITIETLEPDSDLIAVSAEPAYLAVLSERLQDHPLLAKITPDDRNAREAGALRWSTRKAILADEIKSLARTKPFPNCVNIRGKREANIVWGYAAPHRTMTVTLQRHHFTQDVTTTTDANGFFIAYFDWDIHAGDVVIVSNGKAEKTLHVPAISLPKFGQLDGVEVGEHGSHIPGKGERVGYLRQIMEGCDAILTPLSTLTVHIRADTSAGWYYYTNAHSEPIHSRIWGAWQPYEHITAVLEKPGFAPIRRTTQADGAGAFSVSMDHPIDDGDTVLIGNGVITKTIVVPSITYHVDTVHRIVTGFGPKNITKTGWGVPHSMQVEIAWAQRPVTTDHEGHFTADFSDRPYLAGQLGSILYVTPDGVFIHKPIWAIDSQLRGKSGDWVADVILGKPDFSEIVPNEVTANKLFNAGGVYVDRRTTPNHVFVYDAGNSRILGLDHLGICEGGSNAGALCTVDSECPGSMCRIDEDRDADIVLGQPSFQTSACNGDSGYQNYPDAHGPSAATLCGLREEQLSIEEGGSGIGMKTDAQGNLYVPDFFNNRVLRYDDPFTHDSIADAVWGQADFSGMACNRGNPTRASSDSLCLAPIPGRDELAAGVDVDAKGNLWVADNENNRVLRFPMDSSTGRPAQHADIVLGQPDFTTRAPGSSLREMDNPQAVRIAPNGWVYVADSRNQRILAFAPPFSNGMEATKVYSGGLAELVGLEFDDEGNLWISDQDHARFIRLDTTSWAIDKTIDLSIFMRGVGAGGGGMGVDEDGNVYGVGWHTHGVRRFAPPDFDSWSSDVFFRTDGENDIQNQTGQRGFRGGHGLEIAGNQLIYADWGRLLFWNDPWRLHDFQPADGIIGQSDFSHRNRWGPWYMRMRADNRGKLWVVYGSYYIGTPQIHAFDLPLSTGESPAQIISSPLPLKGGGIFTWTADLTNAGIAVQPDCDCLWLSDASANRVFRIANASTNPVVDVVLGQKNATDMSCNQGRDAYYDQNTYGPRPEHPSRDSLCHPGALAFDQDGNLWVADHNLELAGNWRLLEFDKDVLPSAPLPSTTFAIPATRVYGRHNDFQEKDCSPFYEDPVCGPWEPAFDSQGHMVLGFNGYLGPRFPMVYRDPITNPYPIAALREFHSQPLTARFDAFDNLYILDHNRMRMLIYRFGEPARQALPLSKGWTLISTNLEPVGIGIEGTLNLIAGKYDRVLGEAGSYNTSIHSQFNTLHEIHAGQAYWIHTTMPITLPITGHSIKPDTPIDLHAGWNWVGYLPQASMPVTQALASIEGKYTRVIGDDGSFVTSLPSSFNTLKTMVPGKGYLIYMTEAATLTYPSPAAAQEASPPQPLSDVALCPDLVRTPWFSEIYGLVAPAAAGQVLRAVDGEGRVVGCARVRADGSYGLMRLYGGEDGLTGLRFQLGEAILPAPPGFHWSPEHELMRLDFDDIPLPSSGGRIWLPLVGR